MWSPANWRGPSTLSRGPANPGTKPGLPKPRKYVAGGVNAWGEITLDEKRGIAYFPLGSPTFDLFGGDRKGAGLYGDCLLALDARTGKRLWHFQLVHHDLWDYDPTTAPKLLTVKHNGKMVDVVAQATKFGMLYVFDRVTGEPLWPIQERPVPKSDVPGEESWPTQPYPTKPPPFARLKFSLDEINPYVDDAEKARLLALVKDARNEGVFTPQTLNRNQISMPGGTRRRELGRGGSGSCQRPAVRALGRPARDSHAARSRGRGSAEGERPPQRGLAIYSQNWRDLPRRSQRQRHPLRGSRHHDSGGRTRRGRNPQDGARRPRANASLEPETLSAENLDDLLAFLGVIPQRAGAPSATARLCRLPLTE